MWKVRMCLQRCGLRGCMHARTREHVYAPRPRNSHARAHIRTLTSPFTHAHCLAKLLMIFCIHAYHIAQFIILTYFGVEFVYLCKSVGCVVVSRHIL